MDWNAQNVTSSHPNAIVIIWMGSIEIQLQTCRLQHKCKHVTINPVPWSIMEAFARKFTGPPWKGTISKGRAPLVFQASFFRGQTRCWFPGGLSQRPDGLKEVGSFSTFPRHLCWECTATWSWWCQGQMRCGFDGHVWCFRTQPFEIWGELPPWN